MLQSLGRFGLAVFFVMSTVVSSEAALISIDEGNGGAGTLIHDGQGDVGTNNGGAKGDALLMSAFGLTNGSLTADLAAFSIPGRSPMETGSLTIST